MKKDAINDSSEQSNLPDYSALRAEAKKHSRPMGDPAQHGTGQPVKNTTPDGALLNELDKDFNKAGNYRSKSDVPKGSNNREVLSNLGNRTNVKNVGMKSFHDEDDIPGFKPDTSTELDA